MHIHDTSACLKMFPGDIGTSLSWKKHDTFDIELSATSLQVVLLHMFNYHLYIVLNRSTLDQCLLMYYITMHSHTVCIFTCT